MPETTRGFAPPCLRLGSGTHVRTGQHFPAPTALLQQLKPRGCCGCRSARCASLRLRKGSWLGSASALRPPRARSSQGRRSRATAANSTLCAALQASEGALGLPWRQGARTHLPNAQAFAAAAAAAAARLSALPFLPSTHSPSDVAGPACCPLPPHSHITPLAQPGAAASQDAVETDTRLPHQ